ncbi:hypothetical protein BC940DRAFT_312953 [Gongronella butleri]|nr:hypothetical protein BC940DRAFT_312953 [Gongronella butleri]
MQEIIEKRRRRRESHNLVERRRRDNINERIQELCTMLPQHLLDATTAHPHLIAGGQHRSPNTINKGTILRLSVEHIRQLQDQVLQYQARIKEMEQFLTTSKLVPPPSFADYPLPSSSQHPPPPFSSAFPNAM